MQNEEVGEMIKPLKIISWIYLLNVYLIPLNQMFQGQKYEIWFYFVTKFEPSSEYIINDYEIYYK